MITECLNNEIVKINAIILFCSVTSGINEMDIVAMEKLIQYFGTDTNMAICLTKSEGMSDTERESRKKELYQHPSMGPLIDQVHGNILFMGSIDPEKIKDDETLNHYIKKVATDRETLLNWLFLCDDETKIESLSFVDAKKK